MESIGEVADPGGSSPSRSCVSGKASAYNVCVQEWSPSRSSALIKCLNGTLSAQRWLAICLAGLPS
jgi:hypothetical protein